jgi:hypothetical protein
MIGAGSSLQAELVALRVGEDDPASVRRLAADHCGAEADQPGQFGLLSSCCRASQPVTAAQNMAWARASAQ